MTGRNSSSWFAQGLIAEAYQDLRSAQQLYSRVQAEPLRDEDPASSYNLAKRRLKRLERLGSPPPKGKWRARFQPGLYGRSREGL